MLERQPNDPKELHSLHNITLGYKKRYFNTKNNKRRSVLVQIRTYVKNSTLHCRNYMFEAMPIKVLICQLSDSQLQQMASGFRKRLEEQNHDRATTEIAFYGENRLQPKIALMGTRVVYFTVNKGKTESTTAIQLLPFGMKWQTLQRQLIDFSSESKALLA